MLPGYCVFWTGAPRQTNRAVALAGRLCSLPLARLSRGLKAMEVRFTPDLQAKLDELATETGRRADELVEDVVAGYLDELARTRITLNSRYDDLKSGRVKPISREEVVAHFREKGAAVSKAEPTGEKRPTRGGSELGSGRRSRPDLLIS